MSDGVNFKRYSIYFKMIVAFVPLKLHNERLPNKNLLLLDNIPLFMHIINTLMSIEIIDKIYVFCSNDMIKDYLPSNVIFLKRDEQLDRSETIGIDVYKAFASEIKASTYVLCHATSPFISKDSIENGLYNVLYNGYESSMSVEICKKHSYFKSKPINFTQGSWPRTQDLESIYKSNSAFFIFKNHVLDDMHTHISPHNNFLVVCDEIESVDIDYPSDFEYAKYLSSIQNKCQEKPLLNISNEKVIRKRTTISFVRGSTNTHVLTGRRHTINKPYPLFFDIGDNVKVIDILLNGIKNKQIEILPILNEQNFEMQKCIQIYEKHFNDLDETDYSRLPLEINDKRTLSLYLGLVYNTKVEDICSDYVTIIVTHTI